MSRPLCILITGFGPFPGAPYNPTPALVDRLIRLRRPAFAGVERVSHNFEVRYAAVDRDLPELLARHRPDALLMFGLATRTPYLRIETRARNAVTQLWPDAAHTSVRRRAIAGGDEARNFGGLAPRLLQVARATGIDARLSRDAGSYLCNYLCWRALETADALVSAFVHVPLIGRDGGPHRNIPGHISLDELVDAGEALLMETIAAARRAKREEEAHG